MTVEIIITLVVLFVLVAIGFVVYNYYRKQKQLPVNTTKLTQSRSQMLVEAVGLATAVVLYDPDLHPDEAEWGLRRAYLAQLQVPQEQVEIILGPRSDYYTRNESSVNMAEYCKNLPKAE